MRTPPGEIRKTSTDTNQLVQENILLKEQNTALESGLVGLRSALTELNGKLTTTENEKASFLTAIRLLNDGQATITSPRPRKMKLIIRVEHKTHGLPLAQKLQFKRTIVL